MNKELFDMDRQPITLTVINKLILISLLTLVISFQVLAKEESKRGLGWKPASTGIQASLLKGNYRAVIIGNDQYRDKNGVWNSLKTASRDATAVAEVLKNEYNFKDIILLKDASRREILISLQNLSKRVEPTDNILVYYAGHGFLDEETNRGYWIPVDANGRDSTTFIRNSTIRDEINIIAERTKHTLLISDSCFSGSLLRGGNRAIKIVEKTEPYFIKVSNKKSVQVLTAGGVEFVDDNYKGSGHSPFTYFLLNELKYNAEALLTMSELAANVVRAVANNVDQIPETGVLQGAGDELGEFIFARINLKDQSVEILSSRPKAIQKTIPQAAQAETYEVFIPIPRF